VERIVLLGPAVYKLNQGVHAIDRLPVRLTPGQPAGVMIAP
jgi:hypothetical protein